MFAKMNLVAILVVALLVFAGQQAKAIDDVEVVDYTWYEDDYPADSDLMSDAYKGIANTWVALSDMFSGTVSGLTDNFEDQPRMESPAPTLAEPRIQEPKLDVQYQYEYVPHHTSGYPKWIRRPIK